MPRVLEGGDLRVGLVSLRRLEEHGIIALGIKRRIEINKVNRFIRNVLAENIEIVAEIEFIQRNGCLSFSVQYTKNIGLLCLTSEDATKKTKAALAGCFQERCGEGEIRTRDRG